MTKEKESNEKQSQTAARYLDLWEKNLSKIAESGMDATKKVATD